MHSFNEKGGLWQGTGGEKCRWGLEDSSQLPERLPVRHGIACSVSPCLIVIPRGYPVGEGQLQKNRRDDGCQQDDEKSRDENLL